tara:strand:- start:457 stop:711 length:255 start_codon:yes stop_codon:yes gene_type:complete
MTSPKKTPSNPADIALIKHLRETLSLKTSIISNLQEALQLSKTCEHKIQLQLDEQILYSKETQLKTTLLIRKIRELEEINEKKH